MSKENGEEVDKVAEQSDADGVGAAASTLSASNENNVVQYLESPVKSNIDKNEYRVILLPNGLKVTLIASPKDVANKATSEEGVGQFCEYYQSLTDFHMDNQTEDSAMCYLCVNVGSMSNPKEVPGISSVLSGIFRDPLFGSECEKLDNDDNLMKYLYISVLECWEETMYKFFISDVLFLEALKTFTKPLISFAPMRNHVEIIRKSLENELSEQKSETQPESSTFTKLAAANHPIETADNSSHKGFCQVPEDEFCEEMMKFRNRHYSANRMTVVLKAELPLDTLEAYAIECFSKIPNNGLPSENFEPHNFSNSFDNTKLPRIWTVDPEEKDFFSCRMDVHWIMPPARSLYKTKSLEYLVWIFSDTGAGTLRDYLIEKKWAGDVFAELRDENPWSTSLYSTFTISINLTDEGYEHIIEILDAMYAYINFLKREGPQQKIYENIRMNEDAKFRYTDEINDEVSIRVENMHFYEPADYITGPFLFYEYDPVSITTCLKLMAPEKGCIFINNDDFDLPFGCDESSGVNTTDGSIKIPEDVIERWKTIEPFNEFKLPGINRYWPDVLEIIETSRLSAAEYPTIVHSDVMFEVWYKFDPIIRAPTCKMKLCYLSPLVSESVENAVMLDIFETILWEQMRDELEIAYKAGLTASFQSCPFGLIMQVDGFTQKLPLLMQTMATFVRESANCLTKELFERERFANYGRYAALFSEPCLLVKNIRNSILKPGHWSSMDKYNTLRLITFSKFREFIERFTDHICIKCLVQGNVSDIDAVETVRKVVEISKSDALVPNTMRYHLINEIPRGDQCCAIKIGESTDDCQRCLINYYQFDTFTIDQTVLIDALRILVNDFRFAKICNELSTGTTNIHYMQTDTYGVNNYWFLFSDQDIPTNTIHKMELIDKSFVEKFISAITDDTWQQLKKMLIQSKTGDIKAYKDEFQDNWNEIIHSQFNFDQCIFDRRSQELQAVMTLEAKDLKNFITNIVNDDSNVRKLSVMVIGSISLAESKQKLLSIEHTNESELPSVQFEYLTEPANVTGETTSVTYITDIVQYKNQLENRCTKEPAQ